MSPKNQGGRRNHNWSGYGGRAWRKFMDKVKRGTARRKAIQEGGAEDGGHSHPWAYMEGGPSGWLPQHTVLIRSSPPHVEGCICQACCRKRAEQTIKEIDTQ